VRSVPAGREAAGERPRGAEAGSREDRETQWEGNVRHRAVTGLVGPLSSFA